MSPPILVGWAFHSVSLSICVCLSSIQYLSIYPANSFLLRAASGPSPPSLERGGTREWREAYLIVCPIKLPQFEASMSTIATSVRGEEGRGREGSERLVRSRMRRRNFALCRRPVRPPFKLHICKACKHTDRVTGVPDHPYLTCATLRGRVLASYTDCCNQRL